MNDMNKLSLVLLLCMSSLMSFAQASGGQIKKPNKKVSKVSIRALSKRELSAKYDEIWNYEEGLAQVKHNDKWGFINKQGKEVIPLQYDDVSSFSEGLATVKLNGKWGVIDKTGNIEIPPKYDFIYPFKEGLASVMLNNKWGFIDKTGNEVIPLHYDSAWFFS